MVLTPIFAVCCAFYLIIYFHLKNLLFFSNAVAKPLLFYKRFFFFKSLSARTKLAILFCRSALFSSLGRTEGLFPRLKTPNRQGENLNFFPLPYYEHIMLFDFYGCCDFASSNPYRLQTLSTIKSTFSSASRLASSSAF